MRPGMAISAPYTLFSCCLSVAVGTAAYVESAVGVAGASTVHVEVVGAYGSIFGFYLIVSYCGRRGAASATEQTKRRMLLQQQAQGISMKYVDEQAQGIRMKYVDEQATVLTPNQVERFFEVESIIQKKLMERKVRPQLNEKR